MHTLTDSSCALGWITDSGLCSALDAHLTASPSEYLAFSDELDSARTHGSAVSDAAYFLLHGNLTYINTVVDTSKLTLPDVCHASNGNDSTVVAQYKYAAFSTMHGPFNVTLPGGATTNLFAAHWEYVGRMYLYYAGVEIASTFVPTERICPQ